MVRLVKYLKPYGWMVLGAVLLLFIQAYTELALPDYMSRIVNVGIQQGGVESAVPEAIRQSQMERVTLFMSAADRSRVLEDYVLVERSSPDYEKTLQRYPALAQGAVYTLKNVNAAEKAWLEPVMSKALLAVSALADPTKAAALAKIQGITLPPGTDVFALLAKMTPEQRAAMQAAMEKQFAAMSANMLTQSAVRVVQSEYNALGLDRSSLSTRYILRIGVQMLLISLLAAACAVSVGFLSARTGSGLGRDLRRALFSKVESFSSTEFDRFSTASLITRTTNDVSQIQNVVIMMLRMVVFAPIMGLGGIVRALNTSVSMSWIIALAVGILLLLVIVVFSISLPKFKIVQSLIDRLNLVMRENLSGMMVVRAFNRQDYEEARFDKANADLTSTSLFINRVMVVMMPLMMLIMNGLSLLIIWVGAQQVAQSNLQVGSMMAFMQYAMQIVFSFLMISFMFIILPRAQVSANRIAEVLETAPVICDPAEPKTFPQPFRGKIEFQGVCFRYPDADEDILHEVSFTAEAGKTTAFIGSTGSGKSTIINLIPRFFDVTCGAIKIDGVDIREVRQQDLRAKIGYIPQKASLFSGTVESNLRYANENASRELLDETVQIAQVKDFIDSSPEGYASEVAQGGANVSGGQKQRLSIARALVKQAPIYIFDDSFSALDFKTDAALRRALKEKTAGKTFLIVTQRVSTIKNADHIIVLDNGKIVGQGTHEHLMKDCETYREIALSQLSMEELA